MDTPPLPWIPWLIRARIQYQKKPWRSTCENTVSKKILAINVREYSIKKKLGGQRARIHVSEKLEAIEAIDAFEGIEAVEGIDGIEAFEAIEGIEAFEAIEAIAGIDAFEAIEAFETIDAIESIETIETIEAIEAIEAIVHSRMLLLFPHFL